MSRRSQWRCTIGRAIWSGLTTLPPCHVSHWPSWPRQCVTKHWQRAVCNCNPCLHVSCAWQPQGFTITHQHHYHKFQLCLWTAIGVAREHSLLHLPMHMPTFEPCRLSRTTTPPATTMMSTLVCSSSHTAMWYTHMLLCKYNTKIYVIHPCLDESMYNTFLTLPQ